MSIRVSVYCISAASAVLLMVIEGPAVGVLLAFVSVPSPVKSIEA
jgi:hypothetical protein